MAAETWDPNSRWDVGGGGTVWDSMVYDQKHHLLFVGTGNSAVYLQEERSPEGGDNLFLSSILAINPDNGKLVWHYQTTPGDSWDFTATQNMILTELTLEGVKREVLIQAPKNGYFYVLDRLSGELLSAEHYVPVNWSSHIDMETGRPVVTDAALYFDEPHVSGQPRSGDTVGAQWHIASRLVWSIFLRLRPQRCGSIYSLTATSSYRDGLILERSACPRFQRPSMPLHPYFLTTLTTSKASSQKLRYRPPAQ